MSQFYQTTLKGLVSVMAFLLLSLPTGLQAQTAFAGANFSGIGDWENPAHWTNGLPASGNDANIGGGAVVTINAPLTLDFSVQSFGTLEVKADVIGNGNFANFFGSINMDAGTMWTNNGTMDNRGTINVMANGGFTNASSGNYTSDASGQINVAATGMLVNNGQFLNLSTITIDGTANNTSNFNSQGTVNVNNNATFNNNAGILDNRNGANFIIASGGQYNNAGGSVTNGGTFTNGGNFSNSSSFTNSSVYINDGTFINATGGAFDNILTFTNNNNGTVASSSTFTNRLTYNNNGTTDIQGTFDNQGNINNLSGALNVANGGTLQNALGSEVRNSASLVNDGTIDSEGDLINDNTSGTATFVNNNTISTTENGQIVNADEFTNNGSIENLSLVSNTGTFINAGTLTTNTTFTNDGLLQNLLMGILTNELVVINNNSITNSGMINNGVRIFNNGSITNDGTLSNIGDFNNNPSGTVINNGTFDNNNGGVVTNDGLLTNNVTFLNQNCSSVDNNGTIDNADVFQNDGLFFQMGGFTGISATGNGVIITNGGTSDLCANITLPVGANGTSTIAASAVADLSLLNCVSIDLLIDGAENKTFDCSQLGANQVELTVSDRLNNTANCFATVTLIDDDIPTITGCPTVVEATADASGTAVVSWTEPVATDNCNLVSFLGDATPGSVFPIGTTNVIYTATDGQGATAFCVFDIVVSEAPVNNDCDNVTILFVVGNTNLNDGDEEIKERLEDNLGYTVMLANDDNVQTSDADGKSLVYISSTVQSTKIGNKFTNVTIPVFTSESYLFDDLGMTGNGQEQDYGVFCETKKTQIIDFTNPIAAGLVGTQRVLDDEECVRWGIPSSDAAIVSSLVGYPECAMIFTYEQGAQMVGMAAPARRVGFFLDNETAEELKSKGWTLFENSVKYALGCLDETPIACTELTVDIVLDQYPGETFWKIKDYSNNTLASGGPYYNNNEGDVVGQTLCLPTDCYYFIIYDFYGDGICCDWGNGSYTITETGTGAVLASGGEFGWVDYETICVGGASGLAAEETDVATSNSLRGTQGTAETNELLELDWVNEVAQDYKVVLDFNVYPNPTTGLTTLNLEAFQDLGTFNLVVTNQAGTIVWENRIDELAQPTYQLDLSNQPTGMYMITAVAKGGKHSSQKLIITNRP